MTLVKLLHKRTLLAIPVLLVGITGIGTTKLNAITPSAAKCVTLRPFSSINGFKVLDSVQAEKANCGPGESSRFLFVSKKTWKKSEPTDKEIAKVINSLRIAKTKKYSWFDRSMSQNVSTSSARKLLKDDGEWCSIGMGSDFNEKIDDSLLNLCSKNLRLGYIDRKKQISIFGSVELAIYGEWDIENASDECMRGCKNYRIILYITSNWDFWE
jgi:hypothetical protein